MRIEANKYRYMNVGDTWDNDCEVEVEVVNDHRDSYSEAFVYLTKGQLIQLRNHLDKLINEEG